MYQTAKCFEQITVEENKFSFVTSSRGQQQIYVNTPCIIL